MKNINRMEILKFISEITDTEAIGQETFCGKNIYFLRNKLNNFWEEKYQVEFISQTRKYFFTLLIRGMQAESDFLHKRVVDFLRSKKLQRNIIVDTESISTMV